MKLLQEKQIFLMCCCIEVVRWPFEFCTIWVSAISTEVVQLNIAQNLSPSDIKLWFVPEIIFHRLLIAWPSLALFMAISYRYIEYIPDISWIYHRCGRICASCTLHKICPHAQNHWSWLKHSWFWKRFNVEAVENALQRGRIPGIPRLCATDL